MPIRSTIVAVALLLLTAVDAGSQAPVPAGDYITENGWGHLAIKRDRAGALVFSIQTVGANAHLCQLAGTIRAGKATLEALEKDQPCVVRFKSNEGGIEVSTDTHDACRTYCGARAAFDGLYLKPAQGCAPAALGKTREVFKQLYARQSYAQARATLEPALERCGRTLDRWDEGMMRNHLAITLYHLGDLGACRKALEPYAKDADMTDDDVVGGLPPADAEAYLQIVKAARTNLRLCRPKERAGTPR